MNRSTSWIVLGYVLLAAGGPSLAADPPTEAEAAEIAADAFVFGYPLVLMDASRRTMTAVPRPEAARAPMGQFNDSTKFPDATFTDVVTPNADTLYSFSWLDLTKGPVVLSLPDVGDRYYLMQMLDAWTDVFASPGSRTTGNRAGDYAIVGPGWNGALPAGMKEIRSPTGLVWIIGRTQTNGPADYAAVRALKAKYRLVPLSAWGAAYAPPAEVAVDPKVDAKTSPVEQVERMPGAEFFAWLAALMRDNPPAEADRPMVERLARIGIVAGRPFGGFGPAFERGMKAGRERIAAEAARPQGRVENGWDVMTGVGRYGTNYLFRALVARVGLGANLPEDALYPRATKDADGEPLTGAHRYVIRFPKGGLPPVGAFWSLTMYNARQSFVANPIDRYAIGDRDKLTFGDDGSLSLYLQHDSPGPEKASNWLPAPEGSFNVFMRLYWPKREILDGAWKPQAIERVE
jgi:hypothetical protein